MEHKIYDCLHKDIVHAMFKERVAVITPKKEDMAINMDFPVTTYN
jgi:hypothetical protein